MVEHRVVVPATRVRFPLIAPSPVAQTLVGAMGDSNKRHLPGRCFFVFFKRKHTQPTVRSEKRVLCPERVGVG